MLTVTPGETVGSQSSDWGTRSYEDALAVLGVHQTLALEDGEGVSNRHTGNSVMLD